MLSAFFNNRKRSAAFALSIAIIFALVAWWCFESSADHGGTYLSLKSSETQSSPARERDREQAPQDLESVAYDAPVEPSPEEPPPAQQNGRLRVTVREVNGGPAAGITVRLVREDFVGAIATETLEQMTDLEGAASFEPAEGTYLAIAVAEGIKVVSSRIMMAKGDERQIDLHLLPLSEVTLRCIDDQGEPFAGHKVEISEDDATFDLQWSRENWSELKTTDSRGEVRFRCIAGLQLRIELQAIGIDNPVTTLVLKATSEQRHDLIFHRGREVSVRVRCAESQDLLPGIAMKIILLDQAGHARNTEYRVLSDAEGIAKITARRDYGVRVILDQPPLHQVKGWHHIKPEEDEGEILVFGTRDLAVVIDGLESLARPVTEVLVSDNSPAQEQLPDGSGTRRVPLGEDRIVRIRGQGHPHASAFRIIVPGYGESRAMRVTQPLRDLPTLVSEPMVRVEIVPYTRVRGRVLSQAEGRPIAGAEVTVRRGRLVHRTADNPKIRLHFAHSFSVRGPLLTRVRSDPEGRFEFLASNLGDFALEVETPDGATSQLDIALPLDRETEVTVAIDDRATCELSLVGSPIWTQHARGILVGEGPLAGIRRGFQTDAQGRARLERLPVGSYYVRLHRRSSGPQTISGLLAGEPFFLSESGVTAIQIQARGVFFPRD